MFIRILVLIKINQSINLIFVREQFHNLFFVKNSIQYKLMMAIYFKCLEYEALKKQMKQLLSSFFNMAYFLQQQLGYTAIKNHLLYYQLKLVLMYIQETIVEIDILQSISNLTKKRMEVYFMIIAFLNQVNMIYLHRYKLY